MKTVAHAHFPLFFPMFCVTHHPKSNFESQMEIIFHSRWIVCKITCSHQCRGAILVGCGAPTLQQFSEAAQVCHCKLGQSSVFHNHNHNNNNKTSTTEPLPTDSNHCHNNNVCSSVPMCVSLLKPNSFHGQSALPPTEG